MARNCTTSSTERRTMCRRNLARTYAVMRRYTRSTHGRLKDDSLACNLVRRWAVGAAGHGPYLSGRIRKARANTSHVDPSKRADTAPASAIALPGFAKPQETKATRNAIASDQSKVFRNRDVEDRGASKAEPATRPGSCRSCVKPRCGPAAASGAVRRLEPRARGLCLEDDGVACLGRPARLGGLGCGRTTTLAPVRDRSSSVKRTKNPTIAKISDVTNPNSAKKATTRIPATANETGDSTRPSRYPAGREPIATRSANRLIAATVMHPQGRFDWVAASRPVSSTVSLAVTLDMATVGSGRWSRSC